MIRMLARGLLVCLPALAVLPGCQHIPYCGSPACDTPKKSDIVSTKQPDTRANLSQQGPSTAVQQEVTGPRETRMQPVRPLPELEAQNQGPIFDPAHLPGADPKKLPPGTPGVAVFESPSDPPPLPQIGANSRGYAPIVEALQDMLDGRHQDALKRLQAYDKNTQDFFLSLLPPLTILVQTPIDKMGAQDIIQLNEQLSSLTGRLRSRSQLMITRMCCCKQVNGFGFYEERPANYAFLTATPAGEFVQVYVELKNFVSEQTKEGDYLTKLACTLELKDSRGEIVMSQPFKRSERRRSRLNDLHGTFPFYVPPLPAGTYQLRIQIIDETLPDHHRLAYESMPFRVTPVANQSPLP